MCHLATRSLHEFNSFRFEFEGRKAVKIRGLFVRTKSCMHQSVCTNVTIVKSYWNAFDCLPAWLAGWLAQKLIYAAIYYLIYRSLRWKYHIIRSKLFSFWWPCNQSYELVLLSPPLRLWLWMCWLSSVLLEEFDWGHNFCQLQLNIQIQIDTKLYNFLNLFLNSFFFLLSFLLRYLMRLRLILF